MSTVAPRSASSIEGPCNTAASNKNQGQRHIRFERLRKLLRYWQVVGFLGILKWRLYRSAMLSRLFNVSMMNIRPLTLQHPIEVRLKGSSDADVFRQI